MSNSSYNKDRDFSDRPSRDSRREPDESPRRPRRPRNDDLPRSHRPENDPFEPRYERSVDRSQRSDDIPRKSSSSRNADQSRYRNDEEVIDRFQDDELDNEPVYTPSRSNERGRRYSRKEYSEVLPSQELYAGSKEDNRSYRRRSSRYYDDESREFPRANSRWNRQFTEFVPKMQTIVTEAVQVPLKGLDKLLGGRLTKYKWLRVVLVVAILVSIFGPIGAVGFSQYQQIKLLGYNGLAELTAIRTLAANTTMALPPTAKLEDKARALLQPAVLSQIQQHADTARADFQQLDQIISQHQGVLILIAISPFSSTLDSLDRIAKVGIDVSIIAHNFANVGTNFTSIFQTSPFAVTGPPLFTPAVYDQFMQFLTQIKPQIDDAANQLNGVDLSRLPLNQKQLSQFRQILPAIPSATHTLNVLMDNKDALRWVLGVDKPRLLLLQTMDRGEVRPTGGFTGQFGTLDITGGRLGTISLRDINTIDQAATNPFASNTAVNAPAPYNTWWPYVGFGLRDANLSADFPTSAQLSEYYFTHEQTAQVDGVVTFSPLVIEHLLKPNILGPLNVACYNVTITSDNLEAQLHYFQLDPAGIALQAKCTTTTNTDTTARKQFTAAMAAQLEAQLRTVPPDRLNNVLSSFSTDLQNKQIQIYFNDPTTEAYLHTNNLDGSLLHDPAVDTTSVIHSNIGANKGSIYLNITQQEQIKVDASGNAQHDLTLTLDYKPTGDVFGFYLRGGQGVVTMRDYLRIYVPANAKLVSSNGFDQTTSSPLCYTGKCTPKGAPVCSAAPSNLNLPPPYFWPLPSGQRVGSSNNVIDDIGGVTNTASDFPGLGMFAGLVVIPAFCVLTVTLSWSVPKPSTPAPYTFVAQSQSDVFTDLTVNITGSSKVSAHISPLLHNERWQLSR